MASRSSRAGVVVPLVAALLVLFGGNARADETPLLLAGALFESASTTIAPIALLRAPLGDDRTFSVSQIGWTSGASFEVAYGPRWSWLSAVAFTPVRAHLSHNLYDEDGRELPEFDDTALRVTSGIGFTTREAWARVHAVVGKEWLSRIEPSLAEPFRLPFAGAEVKFGLQIVRSDDALTPRVDGVRAMLRGQGIVGVRPWIDADLTLGLGRKIRDVFMHANTMAFYVTFDHPVVDAAVGGSWDALGALALVGHPLGAFRLARGAAGTAGIDWRVLGDVEIGARGSLLFGARTVHSGVALLAQTRISGIRVFAGASSPDGEVFRSSVDRTCVFAGASGAWLFLF
jgi:hypothetical protein